MKKIKATVVIMLLTWSLSSCGILNLFSDTDNNTSNQAPYPVNGPEQNPEFQAYTSSDQYFQLEIAEVNGEKDPDGDTVYFRSSSFGSYDSDMQLNENTGLVTIAGDPLFAGPESGTVVVDFWTEDEHGNDSADQAYTVTFTFKST
ncbi:MAG: hypothetical protein K9L66_09155 [Spirochaetaceae bacterium]|nr:hypothetical protein [Spirochaetaceae bacterium]MCF7951683.1 hypothetical protein [Spirochaetaceae bacterium]